MPISAKLMWNKGSRNQKMGKFKNSSSQYQNTCLKSHILCGKCGKKHPKKQCPAYRRHVENATDTTNLLAHVPQGASSH